MPTTLTLKSIPDEVYERLRASADIHRLPQGKLRARQIDALKREGHP